MSDEHDPGTRYDRWLALDSKVSLDDNALPRHPDYEALRDMDEENATELREKFDGPREQRTSKGSSRAGAAARDGRSVNPGRRKRR